ncbi:MAG: cupin domain-containing protein [Verrucomicrobiota bacterium]
MQLVAIPPKAKVSLHHHQRMTEVFHVLSGEGWVSIAGAKHHLHTGDTVTCEPDGRNTARNEEDGPYQHIVFKTSWSEDDIYWEDEIEPD